jgi:hypothetical protein
VYETAAASQIIQCSQTASSAGCSRVSVRRAQNDVGQRFLVAVSLLNIKTRPQLHPDLKARPLLHPRYGGELHKRGLEVFCKFSDV